MSKTGVLSVVGLIGFGVIVAFAPLASAAQEAAPKNDELRYYYWVKDTRHPLELDTSVVVFVRHADLEDMRGAEREEVAWDRLRQAPPPPPKRLQNIVKALKPSDPVKMWIATLTREHGPDEMERLVADLAADEAIAFAAPAFKTGLGPTLLKPYIVARYRAGISQDKARSAVIATGAGKSIEWEYRGMSRHMKIQPDTKNGFEILHLANRLHKFPEIEFAEPGWMIPGKTGAIPNDPGFNFQWGLHNTGQSGGFNDVDINAPEAWDIPVTSRGVTVLVIDDGVQTNHPDLNYDIRFGRNFTVNPPVDGGGPVTANDRHGTTVAGVVAARNNNMFGVAGTVPGAFVVSAKVYNPDAQGNFNADPGDIADGIRYATAVGAKITNSSFILMQESGMVSAAYEDMWNQGITNFAASGNLGANSVQFPASHPLVIAVGAIDRTGLRAIFSNRGFNLELVGPGVGIFTTDRTGSDGFNSGSNPDFAFADGEGLDGTSYACPYAAGVAALMLRKNPRLTPDQIREILHQTALDISPQAHGFGFDESTGFGLVRASAALGAASDPRLGDANNDGAVNFVDITTVLANWGSESLDGDANYDGVVSFNDITAVLANWD